MTFFPRLSFATLVILAACGSSGSSTVDGSPQDIDAGDQPDAGPGGPQCAQISDLATITFTRDEGATSAPREVPLTGTVYTEGLAILGDGQTIYAGTQSAVWLSNDAGCTWQKLADVNGGTPVLVPAGSGGAYGWVENNTEVVRIVGNTVTSVPAPTEVYALAVDPADAMHVRALTSPGQLLESVDGGDTWDRLGEAADAGQAGLVYSAAFDPGDWDHVVIGVISKGYWVTTNAGTEWQLATGLGIADRANGFNVEISPADGDVVWAEGLDLDAEDENAPRHIYRSTDGGFTFTPVIDDDPANNLFNGNPLFPHPTDAEVLYYTFGMSFQNYGTDLYRFDAGDGSLTHQHLAPHRIDSIAFWPGDPTLMFLGLSHEEIN